MEKENIRPFANYRPHPEDPLSMETFEQLYGVIDRIYTNYSVDVVEKILGGLAINYDQFHFLSPATDQGQELSVSREQLANGVKVLDIRELSVGWQTSILLRNDATSPGVPGVPMAMQSHPRMISEVGTSQLMDMPVSDTTVGQLADQIQNREDRGLFRPEQRSFAVYENQANE